MEFDSDKKPKIILGARQVSWAVSSLVLVCFFVFIAGYFLGKKKAVEKFYSKIKQDSFSDHIYYSMCSMYNKTDEQLSQNDVVSAQPDLVDVQEQKTQENVQSDLITQAVVAVEQQMQQENSSLKKMAKREIESKKNIGQCYAELIGFGTCRAAEKFANKLKKDNISVSVKRRRSKTAKGRIITWYQVITEKFSNRNDLIALVDNISAQERLKDVRIVSC